MKTLGLLLVLSTYCWVQCPTTESVLRFRISENNRYGFINERGEVVIAPQYLAAQEFSEGSCAVRIGGKFGYITPDGSVCIAPEFDYATEFKNGLALVYLEGKPLFIDTNGHRAFKSNYQAMTVFTDGKAFVRTASGKMGMINTKGDLVIDTVYKYIEEFQDGLAIVYGLNHFTEDGYESDTSEVSVIDRNGEMLFPFGKYHNIENNGSGYFEASRPLPGEGNDWEYHLYKGKNLVYKFPDGKGNMSGPVNDGILRVLADKNPGGRTSSDDLYYKYIKPSGKLVYKNTRANQGTDFRDSRAFVEIDNNLSLIDTAGNILAENLGSAVSDQGFENGKALVKDHTGWNVVGHDGNVILKTHFTEVYEFLRNDLLFFNGNESEEFGSRYGVMDMDGTILISPMMENFNRYGFEDGLLWASVKNRLTYFNRSGKIVWQESGPATRNEALNLDYMNRGYFYVTFVSRDDAGDREEEISESDSFRDGALTVIANTERESTSREISKGFEVIIANRTADQLWFNAQDTRLYMKMQAKDATGTWRDIEYLPSSWCGNSYHSVALSKGHLWKFTAPVYEGEFKTKLRIELKYVDPSDITAEDREGRYRSKRQLVVYSNEFEGGVNPAQFWRKPEYYPGGFMDPYYD